ncbi:MAG: peptidylprolyl isomerase [Thermoanaerobaculales bacterium]
MRRIFEARPTPPDSRRRFRSGPLVVLVVIAAVVAAQPPDRDASRREYLSRELDRWEVALGVWVRMLEDPYPLARARAVQVMASNMDDSRLSLLNRFAADADHRVREQVMLAAGRLGSPGLGLALHGLRDGFPVVRQAAVWAACHGGAGAFEPLTALLQTERSRPVLETLLANMWRLEGTAWEAHVARFAGHKNAYLRRAAAYSLARTGAPAARAAQRLLAADPEPVVRATILRGFERGELGARDREAILTAVEDSDWRVRAAACRVLAARDGMEVPAAAGRSIVAAFGSPHPQLAAAAVGAAGRQTGVGGNVDLIALIDGSQPWLAAEALSALSRRDPAAATEIAEAWQEDAQRWRRRGAARVASRLGAEIEARAAGDPDAGVRLAWLEPLGLEEARARREKLWEIVDHDRDPAVRAQALSLLRSADPAPTADRLVELFTAWADDEMPDARAEALVAAVAVTDSEEGRKGLLELALSDADPAVAAMVVNGVRGLGGSAVLPPREARHGQKWYAGLVEWAQTPRWLDVSTVRGTFRIRLETQATPITSREVWDLAAGGFYDGLDFHRVVPNFVVQGGDPRGDGWGGAGFVLPDEPSLKPFDSWRVGIATSGPNTGGSQFFVTLMPADHLTGHYTNFGEVVAGREVLTRIQVGDRIREVGAISGAEPPPLPPVLLGDLSWRELAGVPGWEAERAAYIPDPGSVEILRSAEGQYRVITVLGTWCSDSKREAPRLERVLEELGGERFSVRYLGVDRSKRVTDPEFPPGLLPDRTADRVPTVIVLDADGQELGRVVETAERPIEELLVEFLTVFEGW